MLVVLAKAPTAQRNRTALTTATHFACRFGSEYVGALASFRRCDDRSGKPCPEGRLATMQTTITRAGAT
jgi:hypothetical protein